MIVSQWATSRLVILVSMLAIMVAGLVAVPGSDVALARAAQPETEIFDFLQINIGDPEGDSVSFGSGQEICLAVTIAPPVSPGGGPFTHCYGALPGQTLHANRPASPFLRSSSYTIAVASNTTGCEVSLPAMSPQDYGPGSGWYAIFNVTATCADAPLPTIEIPEPTRIAPLPTIVLPTLTPTIDTTTPTDVPLVEGYERVTLRFVPAVLGVTPAILPGEVCARLVVDPPLSGDALVDHCHTGSTSMRDYFPTEGTTFPMASRYSAIVVSNDSGCTATPGAFREYLAGFGEAAELDVIIDCPGSSATEVPGEREYADLSLTFTDGNTALHVYPGQLCVQVSVSPPLPSGSWVGTMCENQTPETTVWHSSEYVSLPVSSVYTATVVSNGTGCAATPDAGVVNEVVAGRTVGRMVVRLDCAGAPGTPLPPPYEAVHVEVRDSTGLYRYYDAELCFDVAISPDIPVIGNEWLCQYYASVDGTSITILPGADGLPVTTTYSANVFSNETGCAIDQSFRAEDGEAFITITTTCPEPATFSRVRLDLYDTRGEETLALDGELCVEVRSLPVLASGPQIGELCVTSVEASDSWVPTGADTFPYDNAYAPYETTNTSTCTAGPMQRSLSSEDGGLVLVLSMGVTCDEGSATTVPDPTSTPTVIPGSTEVPGTEPSTEPALATSTPATAPASTATADDTPTEPGATAPVDADRTPAVTAKASEGQAVTGLPTTGAGSLGGTSWAGLILAAGVLVILAAWSLRRGRSTP